MDSFVLISYYLIRVSDKYVWGKLLIYTEVHIYFL